MSDDKPTLQVTPSCGCIGCDLDLPVTDGVHGEGEKQFRCRLNPTLPHLWIYPMRHPPFPPFSEHDVVPEKAVYVFDENIWPDNDKGDKAFHEFYLQVCRENSRRKQRKVVETVYLGGKK